MVHVVMAIALMFRTTEDNSIDDTCVIQLITKDEIMSPDEGRDDPDVRCISAIDNQSCICSFPCQYSILRFLVDSVIPDDEPRCGGTCPVLFRCFNRGLLHVRVVC